MRRVPAALLPLLLASACAPDTPPCHVAMERLRQRESMRLHGLGQDDNLSESVHNLQAAAACARDGDRAEVDTRLHLLSARLHGRGDLAGLEAATRVLAEHGIALPGADATSDALDQSDARLMAYASALAEDPGPDGVLRASILRAAVDEEAEKPPASTRIMVATQDRVSSCVLVYTRNALPAGTAVLTVERGGRALPLSGDPSTFGVKDQAAITVRSCIQGAFQPGDVARISMGDAVVAQQALNPTADHDVLGALRAGFKDRDVAAACMNPVTTAARLACGLRGAP